MAMKKISITDIGDFKLGNAENSEKGTGCTVIICEEGAVGGVDVRGGGPATRETDLLRSENTVNAVNAVVLSGGSAFGLEAASGVMRELADMKIGFDVGDDIVVPIVCGASLYDLPVGEKAFPDIYMGAQAVRNAFAGSFARGNHGAGTGATVGKLKGYDRAMKTGLGTFACGDGIVEVGAIAAVNAVGDIYNGAGNIIAGLRSEDGKSIYGTIKTLKSMVHDKVEQTEESVSFVNKSDLKEALAAAAKQFEEESQTEKQVPEITAEEPAAEPAEPAAEHVTEFVFKAPDEEAAESFEEPVKAVEEPAEVFEEPVEAVEEPAETFEEPVEAAEETAEAYEEPVEAAEEPAEAFEEPVEAAEEPQEEFVPEAAEAEPEPEDEYIPEEAPAEEEFIPETPSVDSSAENYREYSEISIPVITAEQESPEEIPEEPVEAAYEEPAEEEPFEEPAEEFEEPQEVFEEPQETFEEPVEAFEEPEAEITEQPQEEFVPEAAEAEPEAEYAAEEAPAEEVSEAPVEEAFEEPEEPAEEFVEPQEVFEEPQETLEEPVEAFTEPETEIPEQPQEEFAPEAVEAEPEAEYAAEEAPAEEVEAPAEEVFEEPAEEAEEPAEESEEPQELFEEPAEEVPEFIEETEEEIEEPVVLTREDMGYDIVFNTTISCLITNAALTKSQANKLASILHDAYARAIKPVHGTLDGDTVFVLATGKQQVNFDAFAALATDVLQYAIIDGAMSAESAYGLPSARDMK